MQQWRRKLSFIAPIMQVVTREQFHNEVEHTPRRKVRCATEDDVRQDAVIVQGIPSAQVGERIQEQIAETISRETVQQRTDEQIMAVAAPGAATASPAPPMSMIGHAMLTPVDVYTKTAPVIEPMVATVSASHHDLQYLILRLFPRIFQEFRLSSESGGSVLINVPLSKMCERQCLCRSRVCA